MVFYPAIQHGPPSISHADDLLLTHANSGQFPRYELKKIPSPYINKDDRFKESNVRHDLGTTLN